ncbi:MAG: aldo/keto reductase, partial [Candidatus Riflebacteria bacterium]|nr:aldo/keto reductase [Candidatus Riflebacteria bacterium]
MENERKLNLPEMGFGTFPQKEKLLESVPTAIKYGYRLIDTSDNYQNEEFVGEALKKIDSETLDEITVISKFSQPMRTYELEKCFDESKAKLNNKLNVYLLHWPFPFLWKEEWKRMENLYLSGKCDAIGVCNFEEKHLKKLFKFCRVKPMFNQFECHPTFQQKELINFCKDNGITVIA